MRSPWRIKYFSSVMSTTPFLSFHAQTGSFIGMCYAGDIEMNRVCASKGASEWSSEWPERGAMRVWCLIVLVEELLRCRTQHCRPKVQLQPRDHLKIA